MEAFPPKDYTNTEVFLKDQWSYGSQNASYSDAVSLINELKSGAPELLNDLNELSAAIGDNPNFSTDIIAGLAGCVKLTGNESIAGNKTFSGSTTFTGSINTTGSTLTIGDADSDTFAVNSYTWLKNDIRLGNDELTDTLINQCRSNHQARTVFTDGINSYAGQTDIYATQGLYLGQFSNTGRAVFGCPNNGTTNGFQFCNLDKDGNILNSPFYITAAGVCVSNYKFQVSSDEFKVIDGVTVSLPANSVAQSMVNNLTVDLQSITDDILTKANDSAVVHLTGDESIDGSKTFNAKTYFGESVTIGDSVPFTPDDAGKLYCRQGLDVIQGANLGGSVNCSGGLTASSLAVTNTLTLPARSVGDGALSANVGLKNADNVWSGANGFSELSLAQDATFTMSTGSTLSLLASSISDSALTANIPKKNAANIFTAANGFENLTISATGGLYMSAGSTLSLQDNSIPLSKVSGTNDFIKTNQSNTYDFGLIQKFQGTNVQYARIRNGHFEAMNISLGEPPEVGQEGGGEFLEIPRFTTDITKTSENFLNNLTIINGLEADSIITNSITSATKLKVDSGLNLRSALNVPSDLIGAGIVETENVEAGNITFTGTINDITTAELNYLDNCSSNIQAQIDNKANTNNAALTGVPTCPTAISTTNSTQIASTAFVKGQISDLLGGAGSSIDTLLELNTVLAQADSDLSSSLTALIGTKVAQSAYDTKVQYLDATSSIQTQIDTKVAQSAYDTKVQYLDATSSIQTQIDTKVAQSAYDTKVQYLDATSSIQTQIDDNTTLIGTKVAQSAYDTKVQYLDATSSIQTQIDDNTTLIGTKVAQSTYDTKVQYLDATSSIQTQIDDNTTLIGTKVTQSAYDTKVQYLDATSSIQSQIDNKVAQSAYDTKVQYLDATSSIQTQIDNNTSSIGTKVAQSAYDTKVQYLDATSSIQTQIDANTTLIGTKVAQSAYDTKVQYLDATSSIQTQIDANTTLIGTKVAQSAYDTKQATQDGRLDAIEAVDSSQQTAIDNRLQLAGGTLTGNFTSNQTKNMMELLNTVTVSGSNTCAINYASGSVWYVTPDSATNFEATCTNVNPASSTTVTNTITLIINTSTHECFANTLRVNGTLRTLTFASGAVDITGAAQVVQNISIIYSGSSGVPVCCLSSVVPYSTLA